MATGRCEVEPHRQPGGRADAELKRGAVFKQIQLRTVQKTIASIEIEARDIRLLTGERERRQKNDTEGDKDRAVFVEHNILLRLAALPRISILNRGVVPEWIRDPDGHRAKGLPKDRLHQLEDICILNYDCQRAGCLLQCS